MHRIFHFHASLWPEKINHSVFALPLLETNLKQATQTLMNNINWLVPKANAVNKEGPQRRKWMVRFNPERIWQLETNPATLQAYQISPRELGKFVTAYNTRLQELYQSAIAWGKSQREARRGGFTRKLSPAKYQALRQAFPYIHVPRQLWTEETYVRKFEQLYQMLTTQQLPKGVQLSEVPKLSPNKAISLLWFLEEVLELSPQIEMAQCACCKRVFSFCLEGGDSCPKCGKTFCSSCESSRTCRHHCR